MAQCIAKYVSIAVSRGFPRSSARMWGDEKEDGAKPLRQPKGRKAKPLRQPEEVCLLFARDSPALANMDPKTQREIACEKKSVPRAASAFL